MSEPSSKDVLLNERVKALLGSLMLQVASLQVENELLKQQAEQKPAEPKP